MVEVAEKFTLPRSVVGPSDVRRTVRELEDVDDLLREAALRKTGTTSLPKVTRGLNDLAETNGLNLLLATDRTKAARMLETLTAGAPVLHMSFAADPSAAFIDKILLYLRENIHPYMLVQVGLQPSIGAGCVVRTSSKLFDFSLRQHLLDKRDLLIKELEGLQTREPQR